MGFSACFFGLEMLYMKVFYNIFLIPVGEGKTDTNRINTAGKVTIQMQEDRQEIQNEQNLYSGLIKQPEKDILKM